MRTLAKLLQHSDYMQTVFFSKTLNRNQRKSLPVAREDVCTVSVAVLTFEVI